MTSLTQNDEWGENPGKTENMTHGRAYIGLAYLFMAVFFLGGAIIGFVLGRLTS